MLATSSSFIIGRSLICGERVTKTYAEQVPSFLKWIFGLPEFSFIRQIATPIYSEDEQEERLTGVHFATAPWNMETDTLDEGAPLLFSHSGVVREDPMDPENYCYSILWLEL